MASGGGATELYVTSPRIDAITDNESPASDIDMEYGKIQNLEVNGRGNQVFNPMDSAKR
jgi:hypothetical protein